MILSLIPWQVKAGAAVVAAGAIFAGGIRLESWRDAGELGKEKLTHERDVAKLQADWADNLAAMRKVADQAQADLETERRTNQIARENAANAYQRDVTKLRALADRNGSDAQRVRDALATAQAAGRTAGAGCQTAGAEPPARCGGASGFAACGFLDRAIETLKRCAAVADWQHAALVEAVAAWPK